jgi:von Willebrand factor type A domain/Aerotolerance regulator N-terminal
MIFAGLAASQLGLLFAAAAAVMVGLYILKLRRRTFAVPFVPLWNRILKDKEATSLFSKLKRLLSLLLQLLVLACLVLAVGDPRAQATLIKGRTLVVLLDASASMQATDGSPTRLAQGKEEVKRLLRGLSGADRMLIAQMDATTTPVSPLSSDTSELERALETVQATDTRADFARGLRFATDTLRGADNSEIVVVSDGALRAAEDSLGKVHLGDAKLSYVTVGKEARNVAISQFSVRRYPLDKNHYEVMLEVTNTGPETEDIELSLLGDGTLVDLSKLKLKPGERLPRFYRDLSGASRTLEAKLRPLEGSVDLLPADNHAFALLPERRRAKVTVVTSGNTYLEAALLLDEYLDVEIVSPANFAKSPKKTDVVILDGVTPVELPESNAIFLDPRGAGAPVKVEQAITAPGFDKIDRKHPLVRFLALDDVNIATGHRLVPGPGDRVVGASNEGALLVTGQRGRFKFMALGFDVRDSDLPLRIAWPLLLLNTINYFTGESGTYLSSFRTGDVWHVPVRGDLKSVTVVGAGETKESAPVHEGRAVIQGTKAGFYEIRAEGQETVYFASNLLDVEESSLQPQKDLSVDGKAAGMVSGFKVGVRRELWVYLLLAVVAVVVIEWLTYHRRVTV